MSVHSVRKTMRPSAVTALETELKVAADFEVGGKADNTNMGADFRCFRGALTNMKKGRIQLNI
jgi:hypothetical protein